MKRITLEIAVDCRADAIAAAAAGADRLELCADLAAHGYTPDLELVQAASEIRGVISLAMVRPRGMGPGSAGAAGFVYGREEWSGVMSETQRVLEAGAEGVVFGCLDADGSLNLGQVRELVALARGAQTVFHRAIDLTADPVHATRQLAELGVSRVLSAGMSFAGTATELGARCGSMPARAAAPWQQGGDGWARRLERLGELVRGVGTKIQILPGGGVRASNAAEVLRETGCTQVHSSGRVGGRFDVSAVEGLRAAIDAAR